MTTIGRKYSYLIVGLVLAYVCTLSAVVPWTGDDIKYMFSFADDGLITSVKDAWTSQIAHWQTVNGRFVAHFLIQLTLALTGRAVFVIINALAYIILILLVLKICGRDFKDWKSTLAVSILILLALPTKFVPTCQIGYIWMFDIVLFFLVKWDCVVIKKGSASNWELIYLVPLSFLAGFSQEAIVLGIGVALAIYSIQNLSKLGAFGWAMLISFGAGAALLCLSPGNFARTAEEHGGMGNLGEMAVRIVKFFLYQRVSYIMLLLVVYLKFKLKLNIKDLYKASPFLWNAWITLIIFNLAVGVFGNRQLFGAEIIAVIITLKLFSNCLPDGLKTAQTIVACCLFGLLSFNVYSAFHARNIYQTIVTEFEKSEDGSVNCPLGFFDRHFRESGPADAWSWYVTETVKMKSHLHTSPTTHE